MSTSLKRDYYKVLGVLKDAPIDQVKTSYRKLALKHHPDRNKSKDAEAKFKEISEAYAVLYDDSKRAEYDRFGHEGIQGRYSSEDILRSANFDEIFSDMGVGGGSIFGSFFEDFFAAKGNVYGGRRKERSIATDIEEGAALKLRGDGDTDEKNPRKRHGDLYVVWEELPHKIFKPKGQDLLCEASIDITEAAPGSDISVPTSKKGDQYVHVNTIVPTKLTESQRQILRELRRGPST